MPTFIDVHEGFVGVTQEQFEHAHQLDLDVQAAEGVSFDRAWLDPVSGKAFCLITAPNKEAAQRVHQKAGHPMTEIHEATVTV